MDKLTEKEICLIKDSFLSYLKNTNPIVISLYAKNTGIDYDVLCSLVDDIIYLGLVDSIDVTNKDSKNHDKLISINHQGAFFLRQKGFNKERKAAMYKQMLMKAKIAANIANAMIIIFIAGLGVYAQFDSNSNDNKAEKYENRITQLEKQNDSLLLITKDTTRMSSH
jgi:hypothetical protein